ncbi:hypothetical protein [Streptomyces sp. NBC_00268]|uniref:hypothetical protein n=1 Tax=Streptomyces sp. NBC_00268 TaxID=2975695 RepID=UPI00224F2431|nr:hypothetical protein [Streptomyces sp. NBC_00268]MCX5182579.1 hypothetical protein [Streptomyces sp. NBC_00268]
MAATITTEHNAYRYESDEEFTEPATLLHTGWDAPACKIIREARRADWEWNCYSLGWGLRCEVWVHPSARPEFTAWWHHHDAFSPYSRPATARVRMTRALAEYGITAHHDDDAGNSWLLVNVDTTRDTFPGEETPHLVVYVYDAHEDWVFVDAPLEQSSGTWQVRFHTGGVEYVLHRSGSSDPATETAETAAFIAEHLTAPPISAEDRAALRA